MEHPRNADFGPLWKIFFAQGKSDTGRAFAGFAAYWCACMQRDPICKHACRENADAIWIFSESKIMRASSMQCVQADMRLIGVACRRARRFGGFGCFVHVPLSGVSVFSVVLV
jgi:hypothetical protein